MELLIDEKLNSIVSCIMEKLVENGIVKQNLYNPIKYHELHHLLTTNFYIPDTSITRIMSRLLFGISNSHNAKTVVGAGTYTGNALAWISGNQLIEPKHDVRIYGLDISKSATEIAKENFRKINALNVILLQEDAIEWVSQAEIEVDLLYIDIDTQMCGKKMYLDLLVKAYPKLKAGALVIAHDVNEQKFKNDLKPFIEEIQNSTKFKKSINLNVDSFGISVSVKGDN